MFSWLENQQERLFFQSCNPPPCLLLIDSLQQSADWLAQERIRQALCLKNQEVNCDCKSCHLLRIGQHPDFIHLQLEKIDQLRYLLQELEKTPLISALRGIYLAKIETANDNIMNALLKTLEEPPTHSFFILSAHNRRAVKKTITSRAVIINIPQPSPQEALQYVMDKKRVAQKTAEILLLNSKQNPFLAVEKNEMEFADKGIGILFKALQDDDFATYFALLDEQENPQQYVAQQLQALINSIQFEEIPDFWQELRQLKLAEIKTLDLNLLHNLYARLEALARPNINQINMLLGIKALFLEVNKKRNVL